MFIVIVTLNPLTGSGLNGTFASTGTDIRLSRPSVSTVVTVTVCTPDGKSKVNPVAAGNKGLIISTGVPFKKTLYPPISDGNNGVLSSLESGGVKVNTAVSANALKDRSSRIRYFKVRALLSK